MKITEVEIKTIDGRVSHMEADTVLVLGISEDGKNTGGCFGLRSLCQSGHETA